MTMRTCSAVVMVMGCLAVSAVAPGVAHAQEDGALQELGNRYESRFAKGDAKGLAELFASDGVFIGPTGQLAVGRAAIERAHAGQLGDAGQTPRLFVESDEVRMLKPDLALTYGSTVLTAEGQPSARSRYTAVLVRQDGQWLIQSLHTSPVAPTASR
jgi:uncharacterized protein (TIGR02246 family)